MKIKILTLFPEIYDVFKSGIIGKALDLKKFEVEIFNIRDFSTDKHKKCDDYPFGGGAGMVMTPQPLHDAINNADPERNLKRIYLSPKGKTLNQNIAKELANEDGFILINGAYEGIDQRIIDIDIDIELSIGDYVLTSGDYASLIVINSVARYIPEVLGCEQSTVDESFSSNRLEYPQYTRPQVFMGHTVPDVLLSGNHKEIDNWRINESRKITEERRPDLLK